MERLLRNMLEVSSRDGMYVAAGAEQTKMGNWTYYLHFGVSSPASTSLRELGDSKCGVDRIFECLCFCFQEIPPPFPSMLKTTETSGPTQE